MNLQNAMVCLQRGFVHCSTVFEFLTYAKADCSKVQAIIFFGLEGVPKSTKSWHQ